MLSVVSHHALVSALSVVSAWVTCVVVVLFSRRQHRGLAPAVILGGGAALTVLALVTMRAPDDAAASPAHTTVDHLGRVSRLAAHAGDWATNGTKNA